MMWWPKTIQSEARKLSSEIQRSLLLYGMGAINITRHRNPTEHIISSNNGRQYLLHTDESKTNHQNNNVRERLSRFDLVTKDTSIDRPTH